MNFNLKFQEHTEPKGTIHDDIWDYIEHSKLILCDFTAQRPNCYIEYGFALGKDKPIILSVEESEGKTKDNRIKMPFDTVTQKYSFWKREWLSDPNNPELEKFKKEIKERISMKLGIIDSEQRI